MSLQDKFNSAKPTTFLTDGLSPEEVRECVKKGKERMTAEEINRIKYIVCCPMCDNEKCVRNTDKCEAEIWAKNKAERQVKLNAVDN